MIAELDSIDKKRRKTLSFFEHELSHNRRLIIYIFTPKVSKFFYPYLENILPWCIPSYNMKNIRGKMQITITGTMFYARIVP